MENQKIEFKLKFQNDEAIARVLTAFANAQGGTLLIGINDKGELVGISNDEVEFVVNRLKKLTTSLFSFSNNGKCSGY